MLIRWIQSKMFLHEFHWRYIQRWRLGPPQRWCYSFHQQILASFSFLLQLLEWMWKMCKIELNEMMFYLSEHVLLSAETEESSIFDFLLALSSWYNRMQTRPFWSERWKLDEELMMWQLGVDKYECPGVQSYYEVIEGVRGTQLKHIWAF